MNLDSVAPTPVAAIIAQPTCSATGYCLSEPSDDLAGRAAVVTGGASGIGRAVVERLVSAGARVCVVDIDLDRAEALVSELGAGHDLFAVQCDIGDAASVRGAVAVAVERYGRLDIMHNNAALLDNETLATCSRFRSRRGIESCR